MKLNWDTSFTQNWGFTEIETFCCQITFDFAVNSYFHTFGHMVYFIIRVPEGNFAVQNLLDSKHNSIVPYFPENFSTHFSLNFRLLTLGLDFILPLSRSQWPFLICFFLNFLN